MKKKYEYWVEYVNEFQMSGLLTSQEPAFNPMREVERELDMGFFLDSLPTDRRTVAKMLIDGHTTPSINKETGYTYTEINEIKERLKDDIFDKKENFEDFVQENDVTIKAMGMIIANGISQMPLSMFTYYYLNDYDPEAVEKQWQPVKFQDTLEQIWDNNSKSCTLAPREHLKTTSVLEWIVKQLVLRKYPLEINYYHLTREIALEKFNKLKRYIKSNPAIDTYLQIQENSKWASDNIELKDGSIIRPLSYGQGVVGKHPHIIILDDIIDSKVIYSDERNNKTKEKFLTDIYPQISKDDPDKKIILIGTAQRKDDLYHTLPKDFVFTKFQAITTDNLPLCPEMFSIDRLMHIKSEISQSKGERYWKKEYMNEPFEALGFIIKKEHIKYYEELPKYLEIYQGWDLSVGKDIEKGDWTVGATIGVDRSGDKIKVYIIDIFRERVNLDQRIRAVISRQQSFLPIAIGVEEVAFQYDTVQQLRDKHFLPIHGIKSIKNKVESFQVELAPYFENGQVYIRRNMEILENELLSLPVGEYDDQADAIKFAFKMAMMGINRTADSII